MVRYGVLPEGGRGISCNPYWGRQYGVHRLRDPESGVDATKSMAVAIKAAQPRDLATCLRQPPTVDGPSFAVVDSASRVAVM